MPVQNPSDSALEIDHLTVNYDHTLVLWDISLKIPQGLLIGIIGPNGAGKSTFVKAALGLVKPVSGRINFFGGPLDKVRQRVAYVPQRETVDWDFPMTVRDLVLMGRYGKLGLCRRPRPADWEAADHYLNSVGMAAYSKRQISQLSGGQQQRVFIARALLQEADLYFMDEPFAGIDLATETIVVQLLRQLKEQGKTVFIVHHDLTTMENRFDWGIMLNMRLIAYGEISSIFNAENLSLTYGKGYGLFNEAIRLSQQHQEGLKE